ncbi:MAG: HIT domain-containing protein [Candidatus Nanoarchaeia archaeon]|nr:HIT domain-containing protein [Candidatus Nanoarchaeia archaeon]
MVTEEELANMSPEQIQELQKQNCIFCHIVSGRVASKKIYEDDKVLAILDINPLNPGHMLLLTKEHYQIMPQIPDDIIAHIFMVAKKLSHACLRALNAEGTNVFIANGAPAGQKASHFMVHIIPRMKADKLTTFDLSEKKVSEDALEQMRIPLKNKVNDLFGIKEKEPFFVDKRDKESQKKVYVEKEKLENKPAEKRQEKNNKELNLDNISSFLIKNEPRK